MSDRRSPPTECANCGAAIPREVRACPECGADERSGWRETSVYDDIDLPDGAFENGNANKSRPPSVNGIPWYWWCAAVVFLLILILTFLGLR